MSQVRDEERTCLKCRTPNTRKRWISCSLCASSWHLSCVRITRAHAEALTSWWCPQCVEDPASQAANAQRDESNVQLSDVDAGRDLCRFLAHLKITRSVVRRVPKGVRISAADALSSLIDQALEDSSIVMWKRLLLFPFFALAVPSRGTDGTDKSLTSKLKDQVFNYMHANDNSDFLQNIDVVRRKDMSAAKDPDNHERLKRRVTAKLADHDVTGAIRIMSSSDEITSPCEEVLKALKSKHPPAPEDLSLPASLCNSTQLQLHANL